MSPDETHHTPDADDLPSTSEPRSEEASTFEVPAPDMGPILRFSKHLAVSNRTRLNLNFIDN
jgi:hypothetical protein